MVEEIEQNHPEDRRNRVSLTGERAQPTKLKDVVFKKETRIQTELAELNRVLGGGVVPGSLVLIGGDPGIGKSTFTGFAPISSNWRKCIICFWGRKCSADKIASRAARFE